MTAMMPSRNKTNPPPSVSARPTLWHCAKVDKEEEHGDEDDDDKVTKFPP